MLCKNGTCGIGSVVSTVSGTTGVVIRELPDPVPQVVVAVFGEGREITVPASSVRNTNFSAVCSDQEMSQQVPMVEYLRLYNWLGAERVRAAEAERMLRTLFNSLVPITQVMLDVSEALRVKVEPPPVKENADDEKE